AKFPGRCASPRSSPDRPACGTSTEPGMRSRAGRIGLPGMALLACLAGALPFVGRAEPVAPQAPDMIFILIDTLRADRVGAFGNRRGLSPFLDSLAARGV